MSKKSISLKTKFQTETIHQISLAILIHFGTFEAVMVYQLANFNDPGVKEAIQKLILSKGVIINRIWS